jgi:hypothetical protein
MQDYSKQCYFSLLSKNVKKLYDFSQLGRLSFISSMTKDIRYIKGQNNFVTDALSRSKEPDPELSVISTQDPLLIEIAQAHDDFVEKVPVDHSYWILTFYIFA